MSEEQHVWLISLHRLGSTSVTYAVALFKAEEQSRSTDLQTNFFTRSLKLHSGKAASTAEMTHVFVDPTTRRPVKIEGQLRDELSRLLLA
jgi:acyl-CoA thioester hydrolase